MLIFLTVTATVFFVNFALKKMDLFGIRLPRAWTVAFQYSLIVIYIRIISLLKLWIYNAEYMTNCFLSYDYVFGGLLIEPILFENTPCKLLFVFPYGNYLNRFIAITFVYFLFCHRVDYWYTLYLIVFLSQNLSIYLERVCRKLFL